MRIITHPLQVKTRIKSAIPDHIKSLLVRNLRQATWAINELKDKPVFHMLHIGKTGGSAIRSTMRMHWSTKKYSIKFHPHSYTLRHVPSGDKLAFVLRDPINRFVSGFYGRQRCDRPRYNIPWTPGEKIAFDNFNTPNELAMALSSENMHLRAHAEFAMRNIQHVSASYWRWFENEDYFLSRIQDILFIGFQESLAADFERLKRKLALPSKLMLPTSESKAHRSPASLNRKLEDQAIANLIQWYKKDFEFIQLCKTIAHK